MTEDKGVVMSWLEGLAARGVSVSVRNGRLELRPARAYKELTDAELLTLRHHRQEIKAVVKAGTPFDVVRVAPTTALSAPAPEPCKWCNRAPCIGVEHPAFYALHPIEGQKHADERLTKEMMARVGKPHTWDS